MSGLADRMIRAAKLQPDLYEEVEADAGATGQAMLVVVLSSLAAGVGASGGGLRGALGGVIGALLGWFVWAFLTYIIGTKLLPGPKTDADMGQLLRTTGFSAAPGLLRALGFIPVLGSIVMFAASIWMLIAMVIAVRQALDYDGTGRAVAVCVIGWLVQVAVLFVMLVALGGLAASVS